MDIFTTLMIAIGLAMDAFAVSLASGMILRKPRIKDAAIIAFAFGFFQFGMTVLGWFAGDCAAGFVSGVWIAALLLAIIALKMLYEAFCPEAKGWEPLKATTLIVLAIATSIDALVVGTSLAFLQTAVLFPSAIIGIVSFVLSFIGVFLGCRFGRLIGNRAEILGAVILLLIAFKVAFF